MRREESTNWVVPAGSDRVIAQLLDLDRAAGWRLVDWSARQGWIDARFRARTEVAIIRLYPPARTPPVAHLRTERFTLALMRGRGQGLLAALASRVRAHEHAFAWAQPRPNPRLIPVDPPLERARSLDVEQLAFGAGLKPGLRLSCAATGLIWDAWVFTREGMAATLLAEALAGCPERGVLMIARTLAETTAMAEAHLDELAADPRQNAAGTRELGRRLGYPSCCVEAFIADLAVEARASAEAKLALDVWQRLQRAWVARPLPRLNSLLFGERLRLISFDPCRFDCPRALAVADAIHELVATADPEAAAELERQLGRAVVIDRADRRAWVEIEGERIARVEAVRTIGDQAVAWEFLDGLIGQQVDESGWLPEHRARVFRFDRGACVPRPK